MKTTMRRQSNSKLITDGDMLSSLLTIMSCLTICTIIPLNNKTIYTIIYWNNKTIYTIIPLNFMTIYTIICLTSSVGYGVSCSDTCSLMYAGGPGSIPRADKLDSGFHRCRVGKMMSI